MYFKKDPLKEGNKFMRKTNISINKVKIYLKPHVKGDRNCIAEWNYLKINFKKIMETSLMTGPQGLYMPKRDL